MLYIDCVSLFQVRIRFSSSCIIGRPNLFYRSIDWQLAMCLVEDLIEDIVVRLSVEDLTRYKSVCKSWYSLISSPPFVKAHLIKHQNNTKEVGHVRIAMPTYWKVPNEKLYKNNMWRVIGSSNGLVCFSTPFPEAPILVCNPWTRELRKLPPPLDSQNGGSSRLFGFGYDSSTDDYKLVMGIPDSTTDDDDQTLFQVLSLKSNTWKSIGVHKYVIFYDRPGILFDGALHWLASDYTDSERRRWRVLLSFDLSREEFTAVTIPDDVDSEYAPRDSYVGIVEDQLCIFFWSDRDSDLPCDNIWVTRSCKGERYWEKLPDNYEIKYQAVHYMKNLEFTSSSTKKKKKKLRMSFFCDDNYKCLSRAWFHIQSPLFVPSLVSPYAGRPSHANKDKLTSVESWSLKGSGGKDRLKLQGSIRRCIIMDASEKRIREIEEVYRREVGETENFYFHEEGDKEIKGIVTKIKRSRQFIGGKFERLRAMILFVQRVKNNEKEKQEEEVK